MMRAMKTVIAFIVVFGAACGSSSTPSEPEPSNTHETEPSDGEPDPSEIEPDPITRPLSEEEVRREATRLAERAFVEAAPVGADGRPVPPASFPPADWIVEQRPNGWALRNEPPAGEWARVEIGAFGNDPRVEVGFATQ
jgi:hypothetical protein